MKNFVNFLIEQQNKILKPKNNKRVNTIGYGATLCLNSKLEKTKQDFENKVKMILKNFNNNPESLINFVKSNNTEVHRINNAKRYFGLISQEIGFIPETKGIKALLINLLINRKFLLKTDAMFVLDKNECDEFWFIQQFYKWYAMMLKLPGYDARSQEAYNSFLYNNSDKKIKTMDIDEILDIKDAIARDIESIDFVLSLAKCTVDSKNALKKINTGGALV